MTDRAEPGDPLDLDQPHTEEDCKVCAEAIAQDFAAVDRGALTVDEMCFRGMERWHAHHPESPALALRVAQCLSALYATGGGKKFDGEQRACVRIGGEMVTALLGALRDARQRVTHLEEFRSRDAVVEESLRAALAAAAERESHAKMIAKNYENAPCFAALLGEVDEENPCTCPSCGHRAILNVLSPTPTEPR